jgi:hypothetical protein
MAMLGCGWLYFEDEPEQILLMVMMVVPNS